MNLLMIPALLRQRARQVLKNNLPTALMVSFLASLPSLLTQVYRTIASKDLMELLRYHLLTVADAYYAGAADEQLLRTINQALTELSSAVTPAVELSLVLSLIAALITPALTLGLTAHLLKLVRGQQGEVADVASRLGCALKAILQNIVIYIKMLLWTLPGILVGSAAMAFAMITGSSMLMFLYFASFFASMGLMIRAALHYSLSGVILADEPSVGVFASIKRSIQMMRTHKADFIRMYLIFLVYGMLSTWISTTVGLLIPVLGTAASIGLQLILSLYINTTIVTFYLVLKGELALLPIPNDELN